MILFVILAMAFFLYMESIILLSNRVSKIEKIVSTIIFGVIEFYYILQLLENF